MPALIADSYYHVVIKLVKKVPVDIATDALA